MEDFTSPLGKKILNAHMSICVEVHKYVCACVHKCVKECDVVDFNKIEEM